MTSKQRLDTALLTQYLQLLGAPGLQDSVAVFADIVPDYLAELQQVIQARDEAGTRSQAHKIKGGCRSVGLQALGMEFAWLEQEQWSWSEVDQWQHALPEKLQADVALLEDWLNR